MPKFTFDMEWYETHRLKATVTVEADTLVEAKDEAWDKVLNEEVDAKDEYYETQDDRNCELLNVDEDDAVETDGEDM